MNNLIVLTAGHYPKSPGACFPENDASWCEHGEAVNWVQLIRKNLEDSGMQVKVGPADWLGEKVRWINALNPQPLIAAEIHFNSDVSKRQKGSETLYCPRSKRGEMAAKLVQNYMSSILTPNRGAKEGWYRMDRPGHVDYPGDVEGDEKVDYYLIKTNCTSLIIEPEFIYNRTTIEALRDTSCELIADGLIAAMEAIDGV